MARAGQSIRSARMMLSPATAKALIDQFSPQHDELPTTPPSDSPESLYSTGSPTFTDQAFEYDIDNHGEAYEVDEEQYESILESQRRDSGAWGRWPESGVPGVGWSPSSRSNGARKSSIISISPCGSLSAKELSSRRPSTPSKCRVLDDYGRRDSDPSLLGFELSQRRSSLKSYTSSPARRRSSVLSNGSVMDAAEDARLRHMASMELLRRRFSEVVEVTVHSDHEEEDVKHELYPSDHTTMARAALLQSPWSPDMDTEDEEDSEIHTAPYIPTPEAPSIRPGLLSNYPLPSAVRELDEPHTPSVYSNQASPVVAQRPNQPSMLFSTPPPPQQPTEILGARVRPNMFRTLTDYQFPPRSAGVPAGAGPPRPTLGRSNSTPFFSESEKSKPATLALEKRAAGAFPLARPVPLGESPLRSSIMMRPPDSDGQRRRSSGALVVDIPIASTGCRRMSGDSRRYSVDSRRGSIVAERRMSIVMGTSIPRRQSAETRRMSSDTRKSSLVPASVGSLGSRKSSIVSLMRRSDPLDAARGSIDMKRDGEFGSRSSLPRGGRKGSTASRRSSMASRKSSIVSIGEYGYLAPQIVIDTATPGIPAVPSMSEALPIGEHTSLLARRPNAPTSIALPTRNMMTGSAPLNSAGGSRFNPMEEFLSTGPFSPSASTPTPNTASVITPIGDSMGMSCDYTTPRQPSLSIMDRPRPFSSAEFTVSSPFSLQYSPAMKNTRPRSNSPEALVPVAMLMQEQTPEMSAKPTPGSKPEGPRLGVVRKAVPKLSTEELREVFAERAVPRKTPSPQSTVPLTASPSSPFSRNHLRRGAVELFTPNDATLPRPPIVHRRTTSIESSLYHSRYTMRQPVIKRQASDSISADYNEHARPRNHIRSHSTQNILSTSPRPRMQPIILPPQSPRSPRSPRSMKSPTVTFSPEVKDISAPPSPIQRMVSNSSFSRFFQNLSKSAQSSPVQPVASPSKPLKSAFRTAQADCSHSSGSRSSSERTLVDARGFAKRVPSP